jgi:hypothetical protein
MFLGNYLEFREIMRLNNIEILRRYSVELHRRVLLSVLTFTPVFEKSRSLAKVGHSVTARVSKP